MTKNEIIGRLREAGINASSTDRSAAAYVEDAVGIRATAGWFGFRISCDRAETERRVRTVLERYYNVEISGGVWRLQSKRRLSVMAFGGGVPPTPPTPPTPTADYMYFEAAEANSTVSMMSTLATAPDLEYSADGETWQEWQHTTAEGTHTFDTLTLTVIGDRVYLRGDNPNGLASGDGGLLTFASVFALSGKLSGGGKLVSILDKTMQMSVLPDYAFPVLFTDPMGGDTIDTLLTSPSLSGITAIGSAACSSMFAGQTALVATSNMEDVVSIGIGGCAGMYGFCSGITSAADMPSLTNIAEGGCCGMYSGCSLTSAASMPSLTAIGNEGCLNMYEDCTFNMSDNGTTLNFDFPIPPITTTGDDPQTYATAYDVAEWMGNTNGFTEP